MIKQSSVTHWGHQNWMNFHKGECCAVIHAHTREIILNLPQLVYNYKIVSLA